MFKKLVSIGLSLMMMLGVTGYAPVSVQAADDGHLGSVTSVEVDADDKNIVWVTFDNGYQGKLTFDSTKPDGTMRKLTDPSKLHALGWHHKIDIEEGVQRMYRWYLGND